MWIGQPLIQDCHLSEQKVAVPGCSAEKPKSRDLVVYYPEPVLFCVKKLNISHTSCLMKFSFL